MIKTAFRKTLKRLGVFFNKDFDDEELGGGYASPLHHKQKQGEHIEKVLPEQTLIISNEENDLISFNFMRKLYEDGMGVKSYVRKINQNAVINYENNKEMISGSELIFYKDEPVIKISFRRNEIFVVCTLIISSEGSLKSLSMLIKGNAKTKIIREN